MTPRLWALAVLAFAQMAVPMGLIRRHETVLRRGELVKLRSAPVDPYDAFRGRYMALAIQDSYATYTADLGTPERKRKVFVTLVQEEDGFSRLGEAGTRRPEGDTYLVAKTGWREWVDGKHTRRIRIEVPFNRFYLPERVAPEAERLYWQARQERQAWIGVRVYRGRAVIENLYVDDTPILDWVRQHPLAPD